MESFMDQILRDKKRVLMTQEKFDSLSSEQQRQYTRRNGKINTEQGIFGFRYSCFMELWYDREGRRLLAEYRKGMTKEEVKEHAREYQRKRQLELPDQMLVTQMFGKGYHPGCTYLPTGVPYEMIETQRLITQLRRELKKNK